MLLVVCPHPRLVPTTRAVPLYSIAALRGLHASRTNLYIGFQDQDSPAALQHETTQFASQLLDIHALGLCSRQLPPSHNLDSVLLRLSIHTERCR